VKASAIDHVGIAVADLDAAIELYTTAYGMTCVHTEVNAEQGVREAMMAVGDSGSYVQLLAPLSPDSTIGKFLDKSGPGFQQMAYRTDDLDALSAHGYAFQIETTYRVLRKGLRVQEIPIRFVERRAGASKMTGSIVAEAIWKVPLLRLRALLGRL